MRFTLTVALTLTLAACSSPYRYALDSGYPVEEPPCCHSGQLILDAEDYSEPSIDSAMIEPWW